MGDITGFIDHPRITVKHRNPMKRVNDWREIAKLPTENVLRTQAFRCMDCAIPFCQSGSELGGMTTGCPVYNLIPEWNDLVFRGKWKEAFDRLSRTNPFPEFTGRACPAPCEGACVASLANDSVTIKNIERSIIDKAFDEGWVKPNIPKHRTGKNVAIIGSGPAGLACASVLNQHGHQVTVYERADRVGGLLTYGIPKMKIEQDVVDRRIELLKEEGIHFVVNTELGKEITMEQLRLEFDSVVLCVGSTQPRDLTVPGRESEGIHYAMEYLHKSTKSLLDSQFSDFITAEGKDVIVIGGGDTSTDCVSTAMRQQCKSLVQFDIYPKRPNQRANNNPWPQYPIIHKVDSGQEEAISRFGQDPRAFATTTFTDLFGTIKNVEIPVSQLEKALDNKMMFDGSSIEGFVRIEESDMYLYPDLDTFVIFPWTAEKGKVARFICDIYNPDGTPFAGDPRNNLKRVLKEMKELGFDRFNLGPEPEFFLFKLNEKGDPTLELNDQGGYFDLAPTDLGENCRRDIVLELEEMGFEIEASHHEVAPGQHEIDFKYQDALRACDDIQTFKLVVKTIARKHGLLATFMPKPLFGINGSGMHCNLSLFKDGKNTFYDSNGTLEISDIARNFIAGIIKHALSFTAVTNPTVNSYKRLVPGYEAPCYVAWSARNRSPLIRIPASRGMSTRVEVRSVDPSANPYLAMAVLLAAGLDGIKNKLIAPEPVDQNIYVMSKNEREESGIVELPGTLQQAINLFKTDKVITSALGSHLFEHFVEAKEIEWDLFRTQIHAWERDQYMTQY